MPEYDNFYETEMDYSAIAKLAVDAMWTEQPDDNPGVESYDVYIKVAEHLQWEAIIIPKEPGPRPSFIMHVDNTGSWRVAALDERGFRGADA